MWGQDLKVSLALDFGENALDFPGSVLDNRENPLYFADKGTDLLAAKVQTSFDERYRPLWTKGTDLFEAKVQTSLRQRYRRLYGKGTDVFHRVVQRVSPKVQGVSRFVQGISPKVQRVFSGAHSLYMAPVMGRQASRPLAGGGT